MSKENFDNEDFEKIFSEIVNSEDLKNMSETYKSDITLGVKELVLVQQSLSDCISHISEIILSILQDESLLKDPEGETAELIASIYKISEDFNDCMQDKFVELAIIDEDCDEDDHDDMMNIEDEDDTGDGFY
jgi:hypothetical protein